MMIDNYAEYYTVNALSVNQTSDICLMDGSIKKQKRDPKLYYKIDGIDIQQLSFTKLENLVKTMY